MKFMGKSNKNLKYLELTASNSILLLLLHLKWSFEVSNELFSNTIELINLASFLETKTLGRLQWRYIIVDEGHRLKNHQCRLVQYVHLCNFVYVLSIKNLPLLFQQGVEKISLEQSSTDDWNAVAK